MTLSNSLSLDYSYYVILITYFIFVVFNHRNQLFNCFFINNIIFLSISEIFFICIVCYINCQTWLTTDKVIL